MSLDKLLTQGDKVTDRMIADSEKQILQAYKKSLAEIRAQTALLYEKYAVDGALSLADVSKYNRLANLEKGIATEVSRLTKTEQRLTTNAIKGVYQESFYRTAFGVEVTAQVALGFGMLNPKQVEAAVLNPLDRIGWPDRSRENARLATRQIKEQITRGIIQGKAYSEVAKAVTERANVAASRAIRIVQTEAHRSQVMGRLDSLEHAEAQGVEMMKVWSSALDSRTRDSHQAMDGQRVKMNEDFESPSGGRGPGPSMLGSAEEDINCFPGDTVVETASGVQAATKRWYEGPLVKIVTASGIELSGTPNHPILTAQGWLPLGSIKKGCNVVSSTLREPMRLSNPDINHKPSSIGEIFDSVSVAFPTERVSGANEQFHGDGFAADVDIIAIKGELQDWIQPAQGEPMSKNGFALAHLGEGGLLGKGSLGEVGFPTLDTPDNGMGGGSQGKSFLGWGISHSDIHRFAPVAGGNAALKKGAADNFSAEAEGGGEGFFGFTGEVLLDEVVGVEVGDFRGHVFNLQTQEGWYLATAIVPPNATEVKGLLVHNCRCSVRAEIEGYSPKVRRARGEGVIPHTNYRDWAEAKGIPLKYKGPEPRVVVPAKANPWLFDAKLGREVPTVYDSVTLDEVKGLKKQGWNFDWRAPVKEGYEVKALRMQGDNAIQGLVAYKHNPKEAYTYINLLETAPTNRGVAGAYPKTGPRLVAAVCKESVDKGFGGYASLEAKTRLFDHYNKSLGAVRIGSGQVMVIDERAAAKLIGAHF